MQQKEKSPSTSEEIQISTIDKTDLVLGQETTKISNQKTIKTKKWLLIGTIGLIVVFLIGFLIFKNIKSKPKSTTSTNPTSLDKITIANIKEYSIFNAIAKDKGFFEKNGLDATVDEYPSGPPAISAVLNKKADFGVAADFAGVSSIFTNKHLRILTEVNKGEVFYAIALKDKGIKNPIDLKGKSVGIVKKSAGEFLLGRFLILNDMKLGDINIIDLSPDEMTKQINSGQIDAVVIFDPLAYDLKKSLGDKVVSWSAQGGQKVYAMSYTTDNYINEHPDVVRRYVASIVDAENWMKANDQASRDFLVNKFGYQMDYVNYLWPKLDFSIELDQELLLTMENEAKWSIENKITNQTSVPNYLDSIYFDALEQTKPQSINMIH